MTELLGILNLTRDSFSDGGLFLAPEAAFQHAETLLRDGADWIDVGAQSSHPDAEGVSPAEEIARLEPVVGGLVERGVRVSVDTYEPQVMRRVLALGAQAINDITGFSRPGALDAVRESGARLIVMHSTSTGARAQRTAAQDVDWPARVAAFFERRVGEIERAGIARERLILDPGMGFFLSSEPGPSFAVLKHIARLGELGLPLCVSTSRKSFLGSVTNRAVGERGAATLASELWCAAQGVAFIRTHDVRALSDALRVWRAVRDA